MVHPSCESYGNITRAGKKIDKGGTETVHPNGLRPVLAGWQVAEARTNAETARKNEGDAVAAQAALENTNRELQKKRDEVETILDRSLLRPPARRPGPLTDLEVETLCELAANSFCAIYVAAGGRWAD